MRHSSGIALALGLLAGAPLAAQDATPAPGVGSPCSYDLCALRVEDNRILRGRTGERVGRLGLIGRTRLTSLVGASDSARFYAAQFDRRYGSGIRWSVLGGVAAGVAALYAMDVDYSATNAEWRNRDWVLVGGLAVSLGAGLYGDHQLKLARQGLARAIWWHNRDLVPSR